MAKTFKDLLDYIYRVHGPYFYSEHDIQILTSLALHEIAQEIKKLNQQLIKLLKKGEADEKQS